jgi:hypothetical protein
MRLSVCRTDLSDDLIAFLWHDPKSAGELTFDLLQHRVLQKVEAADREEAGIYTTHEFIRDYLYDQLKEEKRIKAHAEQIADELRKALG